MVTTDLRRALAGLICKTVWRGDAGLKRALASELTVLPFERMTTETLVAAAERYCAEADVARLLHMCDEAPYEVESLWLCPDCRDERVVFGDDDRWHRCRRCNPLPEPKEAAVK